MGGRGPILVVLVALLGGALAWWITAAPGATSTASSPSVPPPLAGEGGQGPGGGRSISTSPSVPPPLAGEGGQGPGGGRSTSTSPSVPPPLAGEGGQGPGGGRSASPPGDDPALRARLYVHAKIAVPEWRALAAHVDEPGLRAEAEAMADRLARLDEDAERLARAEYDLTQRLITLGGWKPTASRQLQRLNSEAARVIQGE